MVERCSGELWQHYTCAFVRNEIIPSLKDTFLCAQLTTLFSDQPCDQSCLYFKPHIIHCLCFTL